MEPLDETTLILCVDDEHFDELLFSFQTWKRFKPELVDLPKLIIFDDEMKNKEDFSAAINSCHFGNKVRTHRFINKQYYDSQRSAMLTSFFEGIAKIDTMYYLKIDTDCVATNDSKEWLGHLEDKDDYVFVTNPWGYTRPPERLKTLDDWGDVNQWMGQFDRLNLKQISQKDIEKNKISHARIISWFFLGDTNWTNNLSDLVKVGNHYELPDPSQDTFMWYCAQRSGAPYKRLRFNKYGFRHGRISKIKKEIENEANIQ